VKSAPLVSIVIPAFNPAYFRSALQSALDQSYEPLEIIVCDDCRSGEIKAIFDELVPADSDRARYVANAQRLGLQGNVLKCVEQAQGEYVKILCDDDRLYAPCIAMQAAALQGYPDVGLVVSRRYLVDADDSVLPQRIENVGLAPYDAIYKGEDMLGVFEKTLRNYLGGFSGALLRKSDLDQYLPALTQPGQGFTAVLDFALFICLLRRSNLIVLFGINNVERMHPARLSKQPEVLGLAQQEWDWLEQMIKARGGEAPPAPGYVRFLPLRKAAEEPREWDELGMYNLMASRQGIMRNRVGTSAETYSQVYAEWLRIRTFKPQQKKLLERRVDSWPSQPRIVPIIIDEAGDPNLLDITLRSIAAQDYPAHAVVVLTEAQEVADPQVLRFTLQENWSRQLNEILPLLEPADWVYLLRAGDRLVTPALLILAERVAHRTGLLCVYSDEGALEDEESCEPVFKPDFNLDLMRGYPYVGRALAFERRHLLTIGGFDEQHQELAPQDVIWRLVETVGPQTIEHIPEVQVESTLAYAEWLSMPQVMQGSEALVAAHLQRIGVEHVIHHDELPLLNRIEYVHPAQPLVSIIITTHDQLASLERCLDTLLSKTSYPFYEVLIVDRASETTQARDWFAAMAGLGSDKLRILSMSEAENDAAAYNLAAQHARGDFLLWLSPFVLIHQADWLQGMLNHAQRPEVGVTGPRILDPQGKVVSAGMVLGMDGVAGRPNVGAESSSPGYMHRLQLAQNWSVLSDSCLMIRKDVFEAVGALDENEFTLGLNGLDLCLRSGRAGYLVVWTPQTSVVLAEPAVPQRDDAWRERLRIEQQAFYLKWLPEIAHERAYNTNLGQTEALAFRMDPGQLHGWNPFCTRHLPSILCMAINTSAVGHYRVSGPLQELEAAGRVVGRMTYEMPTIAEVERQSPDVVVIQGRYSEHKLKDIVQIKTFSKAMRIFELDDYIVDVPLKNEHRRSMPDNIEHALRTGIGMCDRVVVSTHPLAEALSSMHSDIRVVPNMLAPELWANLKGRRRTSDKPRIGWGGGTSHRGDLELIADVVRELADEVEWVFFGMCPDLLRPYIHEFHSAVSLKRYPAKLASLNLDLALAPLEFHIFNDCKSNLRLLEYGACGFPVICSDTKAYTGHLPATRIKSNSAEEWLEAIRMHLSDPAASYRMGDDLRDTVRRDFMLRGENLQYWANGWLPD
jgi:glycosyltransferase involved in cell wall biosynthesis